jgi:hypothetical protein
MSQPNLITRAITAFGITVLPSLALLSAAGCGDDASSCESTQTCDGPSGGSHRGGKKGIGGKAGAAGGGVTSFSDGGNSEIGAGFADAGESESSGGNGDINGSGGTESSGGNGETAGAAGSDVNRGDGGSSGDNGASAGTGGAAGGTECAGNGGIEATAGIGATVTENGAGSAGTAGFASAAGVAGIAGIAGSAGSAGQGGVVGSAGTAGNRTDGSVSNAGSFGVPTAGAAGTVGVPGIPCDLGCTAGAASICNTTSNLCVSCIEDKHCPAPTPHCRSDNTCVQCLKREDCKSNGAYFCDTDPLTAPVPNTCVECLKNDDCANVTFRFRCDTATRKCVSCLDNTDCQSATASHCDTTTHNCLPCQFGTDDCQHIKDRPFCSSDKKQCIGCIENSQCKTAAASRCETASEHPFPMYTCTPCQTDDDCAHIPGAAVCDVPIGSLFGKCVQCTNKKAEACGERDGKPLVCQSASRTCSTTETVNSSGPCQPCVSDAHCPLGQLCYAETYNGVVAGYFCFYKQGDTDHGAPNECWRASSAPYVQTQTDAVSIDGEVATLCTLRASNCTAYNQYRQPKECSFGEESCGIAHGQDSHCVYYYGKDYCSCACLNDDDCMPSTTCVVNGSSATCSFNF